MRLELPCFVFLVEFAIECMAWGLGACRYTVTLYGYTTRAPLHLPRWVPRTKRLALPQAPLLLALLSAGVWIGYWLSGAMSGFKKVFQPLSGGLLRAVLVSFAYIAASQSVGTVQTVAGGGGGTLPGHADGLGTSSTFSLPHRVALSGSGATALIVEPTNSLIRMINVSTGAVSTLAGSALVLGHADGLGTAATFNQPTGVTMDAAGGVALVVSVPCVLFQSV